MSGGAGRDRTDDLYNAIVALSQLSYGPHRVMPPEVVPPAAGDKAPALRQGTGVACAREIQKMRAREIPTGKLESP